MALMQLPRWLAPDAVDHASTLHGRPFEEHVRPSLNVFVFLNTQEFGGAVEPALRQPAIPREDRHVGDRVDAAPDVLVLGQAAVEYVELALHLHREAIDRILDLRRRVSVEVAEPAAEIGRASHLPEQPRETLGAWS